MYTQQIKQTKSKFYRISNVRKLWKTAKSWWRYIFLCDTPTSGIIWKKVALSHVRTHKQHEDIGKGC